MRINALDILQLIIAVVCVAGLVIFYFLRSRKVNAPQTNSRRIGSWRSWLLMGLIAVNLGWVGGRWLADLQKSTRILAPSPFQVVDLRLLVTGRSVDPPSGYGLWIIVASYDPTRFVPADSPVILQPDGNWSSLVFVGADNDHGRSFDLLAVLADPSAQSILQEAALKNPPEGMAVLPPGCQVVDQLSIVRK